IHCTGSPSSWPIKELAAMKVHSATYQEMLLRSEWRSKRQEILNRDGGACRNCGSRECLQVHHRQYHRCKITGHKLAPWCYAEQYLITLCETCHRIGHRAHSIPCFNI